MQINQQFGKSVWPFWGNFGFVYYSSENENIFVLIAVTLSKINLNATLGRICLNVGCIPSKALLHNSHLPKLTKGKYIMIYLYFDILNSTD
jgi:hypothetical protein